MSKLSIFLQILKNAIVKPQLLQELSEERLIIWAELIKDEFGL